MNSWPASLKAVIDWVFFGLRQSTQSEVVATATEQGEVVATATEMVKPVQIPRSDWRTEKPWKRGTFAENLEPLAGARRWNSNGTFCRYCGDWIVDSAYYSEHSGHHPPRRGSWNWLHPEATRRDPDDLKPNHEEWLEEIRDYADRSTQQEGSFSGSGPSINPHAACAFRSAEEASSVLEPFGCSLRWCPESGWSAEGGMPSGMWSMSGSRSARLEFEERNQAILASTSAIITKAAGRDAS